MGQFCILCGQSRNADSNIHLYSVPKDEKKRKQWMDAVGKNLRVGTSVCSKHFPIHSIGRIKLLKGAIPANMHINQASENNKTDENTLNSENEAWARITDNFNSQRFSSGSAKRKFLDDPLMDYVDVDDPNSDEEGDCSWDKTAVYESRAGICTNEPEIIVIKEEIEPKGRKRKSEEENNEQNIITKLKIENQHRQQDMQAVKMRTAEIDKKTADIKKRTAEIKKRTADLEHKLAVLKVKEQLKKMYPGMEYSHMDVEELDISSL